MKNFLSLIVMVATLILTALQIQTPAQQAAEPYIINFGTIANSVDETGYFKFGRYAKQLGLTVLDSIEVAMFLDGEADVDSVNIYMGFEGQNAGVDEDAYSSTVLGVYTVTLDVAAAAEGYERLLVNNATLLTSAALRGYNSLKVITRGATSGCDATDPNKCWVIFYLYGKKI